MADFLDVAGRSWRLVKASTAVLNDDGELLLLPMLSGAFACLLGAAFYYFANEAGAIAALQDGQSFQALNITYMWLFAFYVLQYFISTFFNVALVAGALHRLEGGDPTIRSSLGIAFRRTFQILGYAVISATVGMLLRAFAERGGILGKFIAAGAAIVWSVATFLVVPIIAAEGKGPAEAIERSTQLLRKTWGENLVGSAGIALALGIPAGIIAFFGIGGAGYLIQSGQTDWGIPIFAGAAMALVGIAIFSSALSAVYAAAVYYYASLGEPPIGFERELVQTAFQPKSTSSSP
jgi:hypothetical protein